MVGKLSPPVSLYLIASMRNSVARSLSILLATSADFFITHIIPHSMFISEVIPFRGVIGEVCGPVHHSLIFSLSIDARSSRLA